MSIRKNRLIEFKTEASWADDDVVKVLTDALQDAGDLTALEPLRVVDTSTGTAIPTDWPTWLALRSSGCNNQLEGVFC